MTGNSPEKLAEKLPEAVAESSPESNRTQDAESVPPGLIGGEWRIEDIGGRGVIDYSPARLRFNADGRLTGNASCNQLMARYTVENSSFSIEQAGTTRKACPPALMNQEQNLLALLQAIESYRIDATGALVLTAADGRSIKAYQ